MSQFISLRETAAMLGVCYETFRINKAKGYYPEIKVYQPSPHMRPKVLKNSIIDHIKHCTKGEIQ